MIEDLAQSSFLKMFKNFEKCPSEERAMISWIFTITNNTLKDYYKTKNRASQIDINDIACAEDSSAQNFIENTETKTRYKELLKQISHLPQDRKRAITLRYMKDMSIAEIAAHTNKSINAVKNSLHKGVKQLREMRTD